MRPAATVSAIEYYVGSKDCVVYSEDGSIKSVVFKGYNRVHFDGLLYSPYFGLDRAFSEYYERACKLTPIGIDALWTICLLARQCRNIAGDFFECGVYKGGSALLLADVIADSGKTLHLFDTFLGMPETDPLLDMHRAGDFADTTLDEVRHFVGHERNTVFHQGLIPQTFADVSESTIAFAHVDVDIYSSTRDCCEFIYPRLVTGGILVLDDYAQPTCPGVRAAVDEYFADKRSIPVSVGHGHAIVFKI